MRRRGFFRDNAGFEMCNDEFKKLCRAAGEDGKCFFLMIDKKGKPKVKIEFQRKKHRFIGIESTPETNPYWKIISDLICMVVSRDYFSKSVHSRTKYFLVFSGKIGF